MRIPLFLTLVASVAIAADQPPAISPAPKSDAAPNMEAFMVVLLVRPPSAPELDKARLDQLQEAHIANIRRLASEGKLFKAGPFEDYSGRNVRGMFILKTESLDEARAWVASDPAVKAGRLVPEFLKWYVEKGSLK